MNPKLQALYGLKFHPFRPDVPIEALYTTPSVDSFLRRVELGIADGGFVMITGEPGTGKSAALRLLKQRLQSLRDVIVGIVEHPQSRTMDFYRELGDVFGVPLGSHNRWGGFKALRSRVTFHPHGSTRFSGSWVQGNMRSDQWRGWLVWELASRGFSIGVWELARSAGTREGAPARGFCQVQRRRERGWRWALNAGALDGDSSGVSFGFSRGR